MNPSAVIIQTPQLDPPVFLSLCADMLGYTPARAADAAGLTGVLHLLACYTAFRDQHAKPTVKAGFDIYELLSFGTLFVADDRDMGDLLEIAGLPFILTETRIRGIQSAIVSGNLRQWRVAILRGCQANQSTLIRACYDKLYLAFADLGLADAFGHRRKDLGDGTFLLEDLR